MGSPSPSSSPLPDMPPPDRAWPPLDDRLGFAAPRYAPPPEPKLRYIVLFLLTVVTTTLAGAMFYEGFATSIGTVAVTLTSSQVLLHGLWYSGGVLAILGAHEFGHYFACRYYGVWSSLPYFIPLPFLTGTLGAVIRIRQPIATKRQLFDIGIAGPIAGFVVLIPVLVFAMTQSTLVRLPAEFTGYNFGEPLLFRLVAWWVFGDIAADQSVNLHPAGWAAWFGMLATALNLAPAGQLDGGHISYAVFGRRSSLITIGTIVLLIGLLAISLGYLLWTILLVLMVFIMGPHHPRTMDEAEPLDRVRLGLAVFAVVMFVLCFTIVPVELIGL